MTQQVASLHPAAGHTVVPLTRTLRAEHVVYVEHCAKVVQQLAWKLTPTKLPLFAEFLNVPVVVQVLVVSARHVPALTVQHVA